MYKKTALIAIYKELKMSGKDRQPQFQGLQNTKHNFVKAGH